MGDTSIIKTPTCMPTGFASALRRQSSEFISLVPLDVMHASSVQVSVVLSSSACATCNCHACHCACAYPVSQSCSILPTLQHLYSLFGCRVGGMSQVAF